MGEGDKRIGRVEIALEGAVVGFKSPKGQKHAAVHAIGAFNVVEDRVIGLCVGKPPVQPVG